jgi:hypothetical protein
MKPPEAKKFPRRCAAPRAANFIASGGAPHTLRPYRVLAAQPPSGRSGVDGDKGFPET